MRIELALTVRYLIVSDVFSPSSGVSGAIYSDLVHASGVALEYICVLDENFASRVFPLASRLLLALDKGLTRKFVFSILAVLYLFKVEKSVTIIITSNPPFLSYLCPVLRRKFWFICHDLYPDGFLIGSRRALFRQILYFCIKPFFRLFLLQVSKIGVLSQAMKNRFVSCYGVNPANIEILGLWDPFLSRKLDRYSTQNSVGASLICSRLKFNVAVLGSPSRWVDLSPLVELSKTYDVTISFIGNYSIADGVSMGFAASSINELNYLSFEEFCDTLSRFDFAYVGMKREALGIAELSRFYGLLPAKISIIYFGPKDSGVYQDCLELSGCYPYDSSYALNSDFAVIATQHEMSIDLESRLKFASIDHRAKAIREFFCE